MPRLTKFPDMV